MSQVNLKEEYKEQNRQVAKTSHEWTDSAEAMSREQGGKLPFNCAYRKRGQLQLVSPNKRA